MPRLEDVLDVEVAETILRGVESLGDVYKLSLWGYDGSYTTWREEQSYYIYQHMRRGVVHFTVNKCLLTVYKNGNIVFNGAIPLKTNNPKSSAYAFNDLDGFKSFLDKLYEMPNHATSNVVKKSDYTFAPGTCTVGTTEPKPVVFKVRPENLLWAVRHELERHLEDDNYFMASVVGAYYNEVRRYHEQLQLRL